MKKLLVTLFSLWLAAGVLAQTGMLCAAACGCSPAMAQQTYAPAMERMDCCCRGGEETPCYDRAAAEVDLELDFGALVRVITLPPDLDGDFAAASTAPEMHDTSRFFVTFPSGTPPPERPPAFRLHSALLC